MVASVTAPDPSWVDDAACAGMDPDLFFPDRYDDPAPAVAVCRTCPVAAACLAEALQRGERSGIWGGTTPTDRRRLTARLAARGRR